VDAGLSDIMPGVVFSQNKVGKTTEDDAHSAVERSVSVTFRVSTYENAEEGDEESGLSDIMPRVAPSPNTVE